MSTDFLSALRLDGRGTIVLGAGQGIGEATCRALAQAGAKVLCVDIDAALADAVAASVGGVACVADVTRRADMERIFATAVDAFGGVRGVVDIVGMAKLVPLAKFTDQDYEWQFDIGLRHAYLALQIGAPIVARSGGGSFTFVGSISGIGSLPNEVIYGASKAALHHLARAAAVELGPMGIRVNAIAPGFVRTPRLDRLVTPQRWEEIGAEIPLAHVASPDQVAGPLLFLTSDLSSHVSGAILAIDGGLGAMAAIPQAFIKTLKGQ